MKGIERLNLDELSLRQPTDYHAILRHFSLTYLIVTLEYQFAFCIEQLLKELLARALRLDVHLALCEEHSER